MIKVVKARFVKSGLRNLNKSVDDKIMHRLVNPLFAKKGENSNFRKLATKTLQLQPGGVKDIFENRNISRP